MTKTESPDPRQAADSPTVSGTRGVLPAGKPAFASNWWVPPGVVSILVGLALWELAIRVFVRNSFAVAAPTDIAIEFWKVLINGELWENLSVSLLAFFLGFILCGLIAIPLGLVMGAIEPARKFLDPWVNALYATPMIALAPLFIIMFGFGIQAKVAIIVLACFFPILINTVAGVRSVEQNLIEVGQAFRANQLEQFRHVLLPGAVPFIFAGLRLAVGRGVIGLVLADFFGAIAGMGLMLLEATHAFNTAKVFVVASVLAIFGVAMTMTIERVEQRTLRWRKR